MNKEDVERINYFSIGNAKIEEIAQKYVETLAQNNKKPVNRNAEEIKDDFIKRFDLLGDGVGSNGLWMVSIDETIKACLFNNVPELLRAFYNLRELKSVLKVKKDRNSLDYLEFLKGVEKDLDEEFLEAYNTYLNEVIVEELYHSFGYEHSNEKKAEWDFLTKFVK